MRVVRVLAIAAGMTACASAQEQQDSLAAQHARAEQLGAELRQSLASVPPTPEQIPESPPIPMELRIAMWSGSMIVMVDSDGPHVVALFTTDIDTQAASGMTLPRSRTNDGWLFEVPGSFTYRAVRVRNDSTVLGELWVGDPPDRTTVTVQGFKATATSRAPCAQGFCGDIFKFDGDTIVGCEGSRCADLLGLQHKKPAKQL